MGEDIKVEKEIDIKEKKKKAFNFLQCSSDSRGGVHKICNMGKMQGKGHFLLRIAFSTPCFCQSHHCLIFLIFTIVSQKYPLQFTILFEKIIQCKALNTTLSYFPQHSANTKACESRKIQKNMQGTFNRVNQIQFNNHGWIL